MKTPTIGAVAQTADDLDRWLQQQQRSQMRLARETRHEWRVLKNLLFRFAFDKQGIGDEKFTWSRRMGQPHLVLSHVAATPSDRGDRDGIPQDCKVLFSWNVSRACIEPFSPLQTWCLIPEIVKGQFAWR